MQNHIYFEFPKVGGLREESIKKRREVIASETIAKDERIQKSFGVYKPRPMGAPSIAPLHRDLRSLFLEFAQEINERLPDGYYKDVAIQNLETASMWAHKSLDVDYLGEE